MEPKRKTYSDDHWIRSNDPKFALAAYWDQQSKTYSKVKNTYITELLGDLSGKRFLDYGCGGGLFSVQAAKQGALEVVGIDAEAPILETAKYFAKQQEVDHLCKFIHLDELPSLIDRPQFDVILIKDVIEHVPDDIGLLQKAAAALIPGGKLIVSTQNRFSLNYLIEGAYERFVKKNKDWRGWDETHLRFYTPFSLREKLKKAGFRTKMWRSVYIVPYKWSGNKSGKILRLDALSWVDKALGATFPYNMLGWNIIVSAESSPLVAKRSGLRSFFRTEPEFLPAGVFNSSLRVLEDKQERRLPDRPQSCPNVQGSPSFDVPAHC